MPIHKKHEDNLNVQIRTKILDMYGNPIPGAIEYDPATGFGKRIKDAQLGLVEDFFYKDGSVEIDGHNFDDTNDDPDQAEAIKTLIDINVNRSSPDYETLLQKHVDKVRKEKQQQQQNALAAAARPQAAQPTTSTFTATQNIRIGQKIQVNNETGEAILHPDEQVFKADQANHEQLRQQSLEQQQLFEQRRATKAAINNG